MNTHDFYFTLNQEQIAQTPVEPRDHAKLMHMDRRTGALEEKHFYDLPNYLQKGDALILNDSKVLPARLYGNRSPDGAPIEFLLLQQKEKDIWEILCKPAKKAKIGAKFDFPKGVSATVLEQMGEGRRLVSFSYSGVFFELLDEIGQMPLPPYITKKLKDPNRYQTVYADHIGSAAAPTAGLHFTPELLDKIKAKGVSIGKVTLHVGLGTFRPVKVDDVSKHKMHAEHYHIPEETARLINKTKENGHRVIAVGTTSCRTLETAGQAGFPLKESEGYTDIFIYPGYSFKVIDGLITNFHLPESTLLMLVSAFSSREMILNAYQKAIENNYRFFSFGDAMMME